MKLRGVIVHWFIGAAAAVVLLLGGQQLRAQSQVQNSAAEPACTFTPDSAAKFLSVQGGIQGVASDAQWQTALNTIFSTANWPGVNTTSLAFLRQLTFNSYHFTPPVP